MSKELLKQLDSMKSDLNLEDKHFKSLTIETLKAILLKLIAIQYKLTILESTMLELQESAESNVTEILTGQEL